MLFEDGPLLTNPDSNGGKWTVGYLCSMVLSIYVDGQVVTYFSDASTGDATNQRSRADAHDLAVKVCRQWSTETLRYRSGRPIGLSLYRKGSTDALVRWVTPYKEQPRSCSMTDEWKLLARCRDMDPAIFYPPITHKVYSAPKKEAAKACAECSVRDACWDYAMRHEDYGYWAGTRMSSATAP